MAQTNNGWSEWQNHVLAELRRLSGGIDILIKHNDDDHKEIRACISEHKEETAAELAAIKVKSGIWGLIAGLIPAVGALIYFLLAR